MTRWHFLTCMLAAGVPMGCETVRVGGRLYSNVTGVVTESPPGNFVFTDFGSASLDGRPVRLPLPPYRRLVTNQIARVDISQLTPDRNIDYGVLFGPPFSVPGASVHGWIHTSNPRFDISGRGGWAYVARLWPIVGSGWVSAQAVGSKFVLQIVDDTRQRVFFLAGTEISVTCLVGPDPKTVKWTPIDSYVDVKLDSAGNCEFDPLPAADGVIAAPPKASTSLDTTVTDFLKSVIAAATAARL